MKRVFIEPEMIRIDLRMTENIAMSGGGLKEDYYPLKSDDPNLAVFSTVQYTNNAPCRVLFAHTGLPYYPGMTYEQALDFVWMPGGFDCLTRI